MVARSTASTRGLQVRSRPAGLRNARDRSAPKRAAATCFGGTDLAIAPGHMRPRITASVRTRGMTNGGLYRDGVPVALFATSTTRPRQRSDRESPPPAVRAMQGARSVERGSRRGAKGGARFGDPNRLFCIHPTMELSADEQPLLMLLVQRDNADTGEGPARNPSQRISVGSSVADGIFGRMPSPVRTAPA
jgi:hypothetical protein